MRGCVEEGDGVDVLVGDFSLSSLSSVCPSLDEQGYPSLAH